MHPTEHPQTVAAYFRVPEFARHFAISRSKVYELIAAGQIETVSIGRSRRIPRRAVEAFERSLTGGTI